MVASGTSRAVLVDISLVNDDADTVSCGPGQDVVFVDPADSFASDCESVRR